MLCPSPKPPLPSVPFLRESDGTDSIFPNQSRGTDQRVKPPHTHDPEKRQTVGQQLPLFLSHPRLQAYTAPLCTERSLPAQFTALAGSIGALHIFGFGVESMPSDLLALINYSTFSFGGRKVLR